MMDGIVCGYLLRQINFVWERVAKELLKDTDLNWTQTAILGLLVRTDSHELSLKELEKPLSLTQSVVARSVMQMVEEQYLEYTFDPDDKRVKKVHLLEKGSECHARIFSSMEETEAPLLRGMSEGEKMLFQELLEKALENSIWMQEALKQSRQRKDIEPK